MEPSRDAAGTHEGADAFPTERERALKASILGLLLGAFLALVGRRKR